MTDQPLRILPAFAPVPRDKDRSNGWKPEVQRAFIAALAETGSVKSACLQVNRADRGAYLLRHHPDAGEFRKAWDAALALGVQRLEDVAMERALHGVEVPVYHFGAVVGTRRVYNDRLLMFLLRNRAADRFAADSHHNADAATKSQLARLKREWREEWEAEQAAARPSVADIRASIDRKVEEMRARVEAGVSPRARALHEAARQAQAEDEAGGWRPDYSGIGGGEEE